MNQNPELQPSSPEQIRENFRSAVLEKLSACFPHEDYHNAHHALNVSRDVKLILETIQNEDPTLVTESDFLEGEAAALCHDMVVKFDVVNGVRSRYRPKNEYKSAEEAGEMMSEIDPHQIVYDEINIKKVGKAIPVTIAEFESKELPDPELAARIEPYLENGKALRIWQPLLTKDSSIMELALAIADLSYVGIDDPDNASKKSDGEFRELNESIRLEIAKNRENIPDERKAEIKKRILKWLNDQIQFMAWQKVNFEKNISENAAINRSSKAEEIKNALHSLYEHFDENINDGIRRFTRCQKYTFEELADEMGF